MIMGIDTFESSEHVGDGASREMGHRLAVPRLQNELYQRQGYRASEPYLMEVACGPMGWLVNLTYQDSMPRIPADEHGQWMREYARSLVWRFGIENAQEAIETVLQMWESGFPTGQFDRVNLSYVGGYMPDEEFPRLFRELVRLCRSGGTIRWMEGALPTTTSRTCRRLFALATQALAKVGRSFYREKPELAFHTTMELRLREAGCQTVRYLPIVVDVSAGSVVHAAFVQEMLSTAMLLKPFLLRMRLLTSEGHAQLMKQMRQEFREQLFHGTCYLYIVWGSV